MSVIRFSIFCLLVTDTSEPSGDAFTIPCSPDITVAHLLDEVLNKCPDIRASTPVRSLIPWIPRPFFPSLPDTLSDYVKNLHLNETDKRTATRLDPGSSLRDYFPGYLPPKQVHVVIQLPALPSRHVVGRKLPREEDDSEDEDIIIVTYPTR